MPQLLKHKLLRALDRRRAGHGGHQARCAVRPADVAGPVALFLHAVVAIGIYIASATCCARARAAPSWRSATSRSPPPPWASTSRCTSRWRSASPPITGVAGALGAIAVQFVAPDSFTICSRSRCSSAWWSAASAGCRARSSAPPSSSSCRTSPKGFPRASPAPCSACCCSSSSSWCRTAPGRSRWLPSRLLGKMKKN